ncbi:hypothetical protein K2173_019560 [Erythroxylum novogranatense]|uniref:Aromatic amino acid beta-eliminating lyase/threonine aldolase domain-containing protein n=1 Tax=Erythroxylum novogranatense TaxID=1862640 RepID=A0AAV8UF45_9ROSI|nr:hypothetical protein K2173_019560 [Erythroxylum novogranatense]
MVTRLVDLRSDTVTKPNEAMRTAMANAKVDGAVLGDDPTAFPLFAPLGTMGNLISVPTHSDNSHIHIYENGGISTIGGVHARTVKNNNNGTMDINLIEAAIRVPAGTLVYPTTRLICLENSQANYGGRCLSVEYTDRAGESAKKHGLKLHIDGAEKVGVKVKYLYYNCIKKNLNKPIFNRTDRFIKIVNIIHCIQNHVRKFITFQLNYFDHQSELELQVHKIYKGEAENKRKSLDIYAFCRFLITFLPPLFALSYIQFLFNAYECRTETEANGNEGKRKFRIEISNQKTKHIANRTKNGNVESKTKCGSEQIRK